MSEYTATMETTVEAPPEAAAQPFTAHDRCDSCTAAALARVTMTSGLELLFCLHHEQKNRAALVAAGAQIEREELTAEQVTASH